MIMEIFVIILLIVFLLSAIFSVVYDGKVAKVSSEILKYSVAVLFTICVCGIISISTPKAIDVYRGRTTLEITYRDSVTVDSIVVFKDNK